MGAVFDLFVALTLVAALASGSHALQKLSLLLLFAWAFTNLAVDGLGFARAPLITPSVDAATAVLVAWVGYTTRSFAALVVFILYTFVGEAHLFFIIRRMEATYTYYSTLNILFLMQLLVIGVPGAWIAVRLRTVGGGERLRPHPARR